MFILPTRGFLGYTGRQCAMLRKLALELIDDRLFAAIGDEMDHISDTHERALLTPQIGYSKSILRNVRIGYLFQATDVFDARYIDPGLSFTLPDGVYFNLDEVLEKLAVISPMRRPFRYPLNPIQCEPLPLP
jgi:hypothetical protein